MTTLRIVTSIITVSALAFNIYCLFEIIKNNKKIENANKEIGLSLERIKLANQTIENSLNRIKTARSNYNSNNYLTVELKKRLEQMSKAPKNPENH